jgi:hypothetical protein
MNRMHACRPLLPIAPHIKPLIAALALALTPVITPAQESSRFNWSPMFGNSYTDHSKLTGDKISGFKVVTLTSYDSISSAQMFGLSEISEIQINCAKGTLQYLKVIWTEKQMGRGKVQQMVDRPQKNPVSIRNLVDETFERQVFRLTCS